MGFPQPILQPRYLNHLRDLLPTSSFGTRLALVGSTPIPRGDRGGTMDTRFSADEHFRRGRAALDRSDYEVALEHFRAAQRVEPSSPRYRSYYGLCLGIAKRRFDQALELCRSAAKEEFFNPELYRNLAQVHLAFGFKAEGIRFLRRGLMIDPENQSILDDMQTLGVRRRPPLGFLPRRHVINRWIGMIRGRTRASEEERCQA
jgi:tetratricopeptide (TPR) repeat protein